MSDLIVIGYPDEHRAHDVWAELVKLGHDYLVDLEDAAIIWRDENGKVHVTTPAHHAVAKGTVSGLFWGTLIGLLFMFPLAPLAGVAGGIMGAALGAAWRLGIKDDFRQRVQDLVQPGTSALMVIVRKTTPDKFTEALRPYGGTVLKTSLPRDAELELMKALHGDTRTHPSGPSRRLGSRPEPVRVHTKAPRRAPSEQQRPALRELVHLEARHLRERAAAVGVAGQERPAADRPGEAARRVGELPRAASYVQAELLRPAEQAAMQPRVAVRRAAERQFGACRASKRAVGAWSGGVVQGETLAHAGARERRDGASHVPWR